MKVQIMEAFYAEVLACRIVRGKEKEMISIDELYERDGGTCQIGGHPVSRKDATRDHVHPKVKGGSSKDSNIQLACKSCNHLKGNKSAGYRFERVPQWGPIGSRRRSVL